MAETQAPQIRRLVAPNPSPMTYTGTNTYLLGLRDIAVIDPGPDNDAHFAAIVSAIAPDQKITKILVTHAHLDHAPLARRLSAHCGAPIYAYGDSGAGRSVPPSCSARDENQREWPSTEPKITMRSPKMASSSAAVGPVFGNRWFCQPRA